MSKLKCLVCSSENNKQQKITKKYSLQECLDCGFFWDKKPPRALLAQYKKTYFINKNPKGGYSNYFKGMEINKKTFSDRLKKIEKKTGKKGRLLDVGCALGDCLLEAKKLGWKNSLGLEISDYAHKYSKKRGVNVKRSVLKNSKLKKSSFDVITYQDVIEHIKDPLAEMELAYKLLRPGGVIFLVTPDIGGVWSRVLRDKWYHYKPGEHISYFSKPSIKKALKQAGFKKVEASITYHVLSLEYILDRLKYYAPSFFTTLHKFVKKTPFRSIPFRAYIGELEAWGYKPK